MASTSMSSVGRLRVHDQRPVQAAEHLGVGDLVRVVPVAPGVVDHEAVGVVLALPDGVLRHAGHAVLGVGHVDPVPVHADAVLDVVVVHVHLDQVALGRLDQRTGGGAVEHVPVDLPAGREGDLALRGGQVDGDVGGPVGVLDEVGHAGHPGHPGHVVARREPHGVRAAAEVDVPHVHDRVRPGHAAVLPHPGQRHDDGQRRHRGDDGPQVGADVRRRPLRSSLLRCLFAHAATVGAEGARLGGLGLPRGEPGRAGEDEGVQAVDHADVRRVVAEDAGEDLDDDRGEDDRPPT